MPAFASIAKKDLFWLVLSKRLFILFLHQNCFMLMPPLCIKSLSNDIPAAILFIPFYLSCSKFLLDFFLGKCYISKCPCSSVDRAPPSGGGCVSSILIRDVKRLWSFYGLTVFFSSLIGFPLHFLCCQFFRLSLPYRQLFKWNSYYHSLYFQSRNSFWRITSCSSPLYTK